MAVVDNKGLRVEHRNISSLKNVTRFRLDCAGIEQSLADALVEGLRFGVLCAVD